MASWSFSLPNHNPKSTKTKPLLQEPLAQALGVAAAAILTVSTTGVEIASAVPTPQVTVVQQQSSSSSILLSAEIKTMDFSLPSSYDSISDAKGGQDTLVIEEVKPISSPVRKVKTKAASKSSSGGPPLNLNIGGAAPTEEEKEAAIAARKAMAEEAKQRQVQAEEAKAEAKELAKKEQQAENERRAEEREAKRLAKKEAAASEEREKNKTFIEQNSSKATFTKGDFVDMGLPSYGSPNPNGKKGFSLP